MSSFSTFLPRIALKTTTAYTSSLPRLYRLTSRSSSDPTSTSSSSTSKNPFDLTSLSPAKDRRRTGLEAPPSIPAWPSSFPSSSSSSSSPPSPPTPSSSSIPTPSPLPPLLPDDIPSDPQARRDFFRARNLLQKQAARSALLASLSPSDLERHLAIEAKSKRFNSLTPIERELERSKEREQAYEERVARRATLTPLEAAEEDARRQAQSAFQALSPAERKAWKIAERERVMTEGKTEKEVMKYLSTSRHNRNLAKFGVKEMERRRKERERYEKWGPVVVKERVPREDKRKGIHGLQARNARAEFLSERLGGGRRGGTASRRP